MGLNFRKSITICKGLKVNFGKNGASLSFGIPGLRKTIHSSGKTTTSIGIPGTGLYYTSTDNPKKQSSRNSNQYNRNTEIYEEETYDSEYEQDALKYNLQKQSFTNINNSQNAGNINRKLTADEIKSIYKVCDETVDWTEIFANEIPRDAENHRENWDYLHAIAGKVLEGDIDAYLEVIAQTNPLDDLLDYGSDFEFGTDRSNKIEVEFRVKSGKVLSHKGEINKSEYTKLLHDYVFACSIRIACDMLALLPVQYVLVHAVDVLDESDETILSIAFDRKTINSINFNFADPSNVMNKFKHNVKYDMNDIFLPVERLEL